MLSVRQALDGVIAAAVTPFRPDRSIDQQSFDHHVDCLLGSPSTSGLVLNANAGEVLALSDDERVTLIESAAGIGSRHGKPVIAGIPANNPTEAKRSIAAAMAAGAAGVLLYPSMGWGPGRPAGAAVDYVGEIARSTAAPIVLFQFPWRRETLSYDSRTLAQLCSIPNVIGVKDSVWEVNLFERDCIEVRKAAPDTRIVTGCDEHVLYTYIAGATGAILSLAAICPSAIRDIAVSLRKKDLEEARAIHLDMRPIVEALYVAAPGASRRARVKAALVELGQIEHATVRLPLVDLPTGEHSAVNDFIRSYDDRRQMLLRGSLQAAAGQKKRAASR